MSTWECPFCGKFSVLSKIEKKYSNFAIDADTSYGPLFVEGWVHVCPNPDCKEFTFQTEVSVARKDVGGFSAGKTIDYWFNRPQGIVKVFPNYIPQAILNDYKEAALISELSPKASATLARRCLQGMIRDFWGVKEKNLFEEIKAIKDKVDPETWDAIDAIRSIGNIGAHMEKDIDLIIEVDSSEAGMLISLIETLLTDWYVQRETRRQRSMAIVEAANQKKQQRQQ